MCIRGGARGDEHSAARMPHKRDRAWLGFDGLGKRDHDIGFARIRPVRAACLSLA